MDRVIIQGYGRADGTYSTDLVELANIGLPGSLTQREQHKVKLTTNVLPMDLPDAVAGMDAAVMVALVGVVLARNGVTTVKENQIWDAKFVYVTADAEVPAAEGRTVTFVLASRDEEAAEDDALPPAETLPSGQRSRNGGTSTAPMSGLQVNDPSRTGVPDSERSVASVHLTSAS